MQSMDRKNTEDILVEAGLISPGKLQEIKQIELVTGEKIEKILLAEGVINYKETFEIRAKKMGVDFVDLENACINKNAISVIRSEIAVEYSVLPFDIVNNLLFLAMENPDDIFLIDEIKVFAQMEIKPFLADNRLLHKAIRYFYETNEQDIQKTADDMSESITTKDDIADTIKKNEGDKSSAAVEDSVTSADEYIRNIILKALRTGATDIHFDSVNRKLRVRLRVDGVLIEEKLKNSIDYKELVIRIKVMAGLFTCDIDKPRKGFINYTLSENEKIILEVLVLPILEGETLLVRLESTPRYIAMEELGISEKEQKQIAGMLEKRSGVIIVTGLNGSGRTTTCYAMIKSILSKELNIITLEKKVAQKVDGISQVQCKPGIVEPEFVASILMHDPDVVMADIDLNTAAEKDRNILKQLMNTALSGKLVIVTLSYPSVIETISGLINSGFENYIVAASIDGIIAQHMVRRVCSNCKNRKYEGGAVHLMGDDDNNHIHRQKCMECNGAGYKGKVGIFELFGMNRDFRKLILKDESLELLEKNMGKEHDSFRNNCIKLINDNITTVEEIIRIGVGKDVLNF